MGCRKESSIKPEIKYLIMLMHCCKQCDSRGKLMQCFHCPKCGEERLTVTKGYTPICQCGGGITKIWFLEELKGPK